MFCGETAQPLLLASNQLYKIPYVVISKLGGGILNLWFIVWMILRIHSSVLLNIFIHFSLRDKVLPGHGINCRLVRGWCCQLTDLVYDGVFEVLQWLLFLSAVPPVQLLTRWCVTAKALPDISAISALTAVKHGNCSSLTPLLNPVRTRKSLIWPWMALDAGQPPALWALASTRFSAI